MLPLICRLLGHSVRNDRGRHSTVQFRHCACMKMGRKSNYSSVSKQTMELHSHQLTAFCVGRYHIVTSITLDAMQQ